MESTETTSPQAWPELPLAQWRDTCDTLHMYCQIVGKVRLALSPPEPQWAHTALYVTPRGLTTGVVPYGDSIFTVDFDFHEHRLTIVTSDGLQQTLELRAQPVREFYARFMAALRELGIDARMWPMPVEVSNPIRFDRDTEHHSYDPASAKRFAEVLAHISAAFERHRAPFRLRHTRVQFFFGSFDLAYARYSGRPATPPSDDTIMRSAMNAQEIAAGFWPGDDRFPEPALYCYAFPKPAGAETIRVEPQAAFWSDALGEFVLRYDDIRRAPSPSAAIHAFLTSTFDGYAALANWQLPS